MKDMSQLEVLLGMLQRYGVRHYQDDEVELEMGPSTVPVELSGPVGNLAEADAMEEDYLSEAYAASTVVPLDLRKLREDRKGQV